MALHVPHCMQERRTSPPTAFIPRSGANSSNDNPHLFAPGGPFVGRSRPPEGTSSDRLCVVCCRVHPERTRRCRGGRAPPGERGGVRPARPVSAGGRSARPRRPGPARESASPLGSGPAVAQVTCPTCYCNGPFGLYGRSALRRRGVWPLFAASETGAVGATPWVVKIVVYGDERADPAGRPRRSPRLRRSTAAGTRRRRRLAALTTAMRGRRGRTHRSVRRPDG